MNPTAIFHLINFAEWESLEHFSAALNSGELQELAEGSGEFPLYHGRYEVIRT